MSFHRIQVRFAIYIGVILCLLLAGIFKLQSVEQDRVARLMDQRKLDKEALVDELIALRGEPLRALAYDYSWWGEMIAFVEHPTAAWASENIDAGLGTYGADAGWVFDYSGRTIYVGTDDDQRDIKEDSALAQTIVESARRDGFGHFFIQSGAGLIEVRTAPIQPSSDSTRTSQPRGYFAAGRVWSAQYLDRIAQTAGLEIKLVPLKACSSIAMVTSGDPSDEILTFSRTLRNAEGAIVGGLRCDLRSEFQSQLAHTLDTERRYIWLFGATVLGLFGLILFFTLTLPLRDMLRQTDDSRAASMAVAEAGQATLRRFRMLLRAFYTRQSELLAEISDRRRAESALKQSEHRYRIVAKQTGQLLYDWDVTTGKIHWAGAIEELTGYSPVEFAAVDIKRWEELIHPNDRADALELLEAAAKSDGKYECEYRFRTYDGRYVYVEDTGSYLKDDDGQPYRMLGAMKDISERRQSDETRRLDESRLETLLKLNQMIEQPEVTIVRFAMEQAVQLTKSKVGYIAQVSEDEQKFTILAWSDSAMKECRMMDKAPEFQVEAQCLLSRSVIERGVTIVEDYESTTVPKKGTPPGHVHITRFAAVPIFDGHRIVMIAAVANKENSYDESDTRQLNLLISGLWGILRRKQAEKKLQFSENQYRAIFETAGDAIFLMTGDTFVDCNARTLEIFGCTRSEIIGQPPYRFSPERQPDGRYSTDKAIDKINAALAGEPQFFEWVHSRHDGTLFDAEVSLNRFEIEEQIMILAVVRDISWRKEAERELHKARMLLDAAVAQSPSAVLIASAPDEIVQYVNSLGVSMWAEPGGTLIGRRLDDILSPWQFYDIDESTLLNRMQLPLCRAIKIGESTLNREVVARHADGRQYWLSISASPIRNREGRLFAGMAIIQDVSHIKQADRQQRELQDQLQRAQRMESLGLLAGGVAHDLNNMLGPVVGYSELLERQLASNPPLASKAGKIVKAAKDAANVIQDLLTLARRGRYAMTPLDLNAAFNSFLDSPGVASLRERHPGVRFNLELSAGSLPILGSESHLAKVFMNLVGNACEAMPNGGTLTISTEIRHLYQLLSGYSDINPGDYVVMRVKDTGTGISKEDLPKIFEPYYSKKQLGQSGTGLGLSIVYGVVKDHGGMYDVFSELGQGTEFVLYFPLSGEDVNQSVKCAAIRGGSEKILVVDDISEQRELARDVLAGLGYDVKMSANGREAVRYLAANDVDLILLDMVMEPDFDGLETARSILAQKSAQKIVVVSGFSTTDRVREMQSLGVGPMLHKPYTVDAIGAIVRTVLDSPSPLVPSR